MFPAYNLDKIKFSSGNQTFGKAVDLYENKKVTQFENVMSGYSAVVLGTKPYRVFVSARHFDHGHCECYLGQNDTLCKHMVAVAIYAVMNGGPISEKDKEAVADCPQCGGHLGTLSEEKLSVTKKSITDAMRYIKSYSGPSKKWFAYQDSLFEGCNRLSAIVSELPVSKQTAGLLVDLLLRLDKKLRTGGVDDSDGTVGSFMYGTVDVLKKYVELDLSCIKVFEKLCGESTCFEWEEPLVRLFDDGVD